MRTGEGVDLQSRLPWLSAYLGRVNLLGTEAYLAATPELLGVAGDRFVDVLPDGDAHNEPACQSDALSGLASDSTGPGAPLKRNVDPIASSQNVPWGRRLPFCLRHLGEAAATDFRGLYEEVAWLRGEGVASISEIGPSKRLILSSPRAVVPARRNEEARCAVAFAAQASDSTQHSRSRTALSTRARSPTASERGSAIGWDSFAELSAACPT